MVHWQIYTVVQKVSHKVLVLTASEIHRFSKFFHGNSNKFAIPHLKCVDTLSWEILLSAFGYATNIHKVMYRRVWGVVGTISIFIANLLHGVPVKEFLKSVLKKLRAGETWFLTFYGPPGICLWAVLAHITMDKQTNVRLMTSISWQSHRRRWTTTTSWIRTSSHTAPSDTSEHTSTNSTRTSNQPPYCLLIGLL